MSIESAKFLTVAQRHVTHFKGRLHTGGPNVRRGECEMYLAIWQDIVDSIERFGDGMFPMIYLTERELTEVRDAWVSGEFERT